MPSEALERRLGALGVLGSFSRGRGANDNPDIESLLTRAKNHPDEPGQPCTSRGKACQGSQQLRIEATISTNIAILHSRHPIRAKAGLWINKPVGPKSNLGDTATLMHADGSRKIDGPPVGRPLDMASRPSIKARPTKAQ
jgi:hypothetical protein